MLHRSSSKEQGTVGPRPMYMSNKQMGNYLKDLRDNRVARPQGSRPPPPSSSITRRSMAAEPIPLSRGSFSSRSSRDGMSSRGSSILSHYQNPDESNLSGRSSPDKINGDMDTQNGQREVEKQEARVIRSAMEEMDLEDEQRIVRAAREEAAELVWQHQNSEAPYPLSQAPTKLQEPRRSESNIQDSNSSVYIQESDQTGLEVKEAYKVQPLGSHNEESNQQAAPLRSSSRKLSHTFSLSRLANRRRSGNALRSISGNNRKMPSEENTSEGPKNQAQGPQLEKDNEKSVLVPQARRNPFARAQSSKQTLKSSPEKSKSNAGFFNRVEIQRNPPSQSRDPTYVSNSSPLLERQQSPISQGSYDETKEQVQYKGGVEVRGEDIRAATSMRMKDRSPHLPSPTIISDKPERPIVSFDQDWKPSKSDQTQDHGWKPNQRRPSPSPSAADDASPRSPPKSCSTPVVPRIQHPIEPEKTTTRGPNSSTPPVPEINVPEIDLPEENGSSIPQINIQPTPTISLEDTPQTMADETPTIQTPGTPSSQSNVTLTPSPRRKPLPKINGPGLHQKENISPRTRPSPHHSSTAPSSLPHWSPAFKTATALCAQCALPIQGRVLTAAGTRFHPECFVCHHCHQALECVEFFPEPDDKRDARLERIERRMEGEDVEAPEGSTPEDDNDDSLRFYCALDFHEFFSPRCKSCKTPIEGEVIVACGAEWHVGHFFCAQCGDPFDPSIPFVEKEGYAWCVNCHTNRYSAKCKKCRRPVTQTVLRALGAEWHKECFCCTECSGSFDDGRYFLRGNSQDPVCFACEERRLKA